MSDLELVRLLLRLEQHIRTREGEGWAVLVTEIHEAVKRIEQRRTCA